MREPLSVQTPGGQAVRRVVGLLDGLGGGAEGQHGQHRAEDLLAGDPVGLGDAGEERRREPEAVGRAARTAADQRSAPSASPMSESSRILASCSAELIAPTSVFLSSGSPTRSVAIRRLSRSSSSSATRLLHQQAGAGAADVALVEEDAVDDALDGLVDGRVVEDDVGGLAAELEGDPLVGAGHGLGDRAADLGRAGEGDLVDVRVRDERPAGLAGAGDDVDDAGRQVGLLADLGEQQRGQRRGLGRLEHDRVAGGERRRDLPRQHQQREVPRDDLAGHAERLRVAAEAGVLELVGPARVVEEVRGDDGHVDVARLLDRLAVVDRLQHRELAAALLDDPGDPEEVLGALAAGHPRPDAGVGAPGGLDGGVDVGLAGLGDLGQHLLGGGADRLERLCRCRRRTRR